MDKISYILRGKNDLPEIVEFDVTDSEHPDINSERFLDINEIVDDIINHRIDEEFTHELIDTNFDYLIKFHSNFGRWIRNTYGLWNPQNTITFSNILHPDEVSQKIIEQVWKKL